MVVDRGMAFDDNLAEITHRKLHYVVASRQPERDRWLGRPRGHRRLRPGAAPAFAAQPGAEEDRDRGQDPRRRRKDLRAVPQRAAHRQGPRHPHQAGRAAARGSRQARQARRREEPGQGREDQPGDRTLEGALPRVARYFDLSYDAQTATLQAQFNADKHAKAEQLDGCYLIKTDRNDLSGDELWRIYILLTRAENAFRDMKSPLAERPIFHHTERRTEAHIFLCVLAYHLLIAIEKTLLDQGIHSSWPTVRDTLKSHQVCTIVLPADNGSCLRIRKAATAEPDVQDLYRRLAISPHIIKPQHSWTPAHSD